MKAAKEAPKAATARHKHEATAAQTAAKAAHTTGTDKHLGRSEAARGNVWANPMKIEDQMVGPEGVRPEGREPKPRKSGAQRVGGFNFRVDISFSWRLLVEFRLCLKCWGPPKCTLGVLGVIVCEPRRPGLVEDMIMK